MVGYDRMKYETKRLGLKVGARVYDRWDRYKRGVVREVRKTYMKIAFGVELKRYDVAHLQFLEPWSD